MKAAAEFADTDRLYVLSDLHGRHRRLEPLLARILREADSAEVRLLIAGDLGLRPGCGTSALLRGCRGIIRAVRGNCDTRETEEAAGFPLPLADRFFFCGRTVLMMHGHTLSTGCPLLPSGSLFITGHTHVPSLYCDDKTGIVMINPGSLEEPRQGSPASYAVITAEAVELRRADTGAVLQRLVLE
jgi:uncharacterized protein